MNREFTLQDLEDAIAEAKQQGFPPTAAVRIHQPDAKVMCDVLSPIRHAEIRKSQVFIKEDGPVDQQSYRHKVLVLSPFVSGTSTKR